MKKRLELLIPLVIVAVSFLAELILGNFVYFAFVAGRDQAVNFRPDKQTYTVSESSEQIYIGGFDMKLNSVSLKIRAAEQNAHPSSARIGIYTDDESVTDAYTLAAKQEISVSAYETEKTVFCNSGGRATDMIITFENLEGEIEVSSVTVNPEYKISFNSSRFALLIIIGVLIYIFKSRPENPLLSYDKRHKRSLILSVAVCAGCALIVTALNISGEGFSGIEYPLIYGVESYDPYVQQFDAFMKGQLHLDVVPDEKLLLLKNPYITNDREGIPYLWDRAFFNGKYYSYFGIAPILTVYLPIYLISGMLPDAGFVMAVFGMMTAVFFALALEEYAHFSGKKDYGYFPAFCAVSAFLSSFALLILRGRARFYYIASMSGMAFSAAFIYFMLKAVGAEKNAKRFLFFALSGISFGLGFLSRVNSVLPLAVVSAAFVILWSIRRIKAKKLPLLLGEAASLGLPVAAALAVSMAYNKMRFGSFFDFGTDYQLTVSDTSLYSVGLFGLVPSVFHYFLQNLTFIAEFPFVSFDYVAAQDIGRYVYIDSGLGIFAMPFMLTVLLCPVVFRKKSFGINRKILFGFALFSLPLTAFLNFCLGGVIFRYTADLSLVAAFLAGVVALETADSVLKQFGQKGYRLFRNGLFALGGANAVTAAGMTLMESGNLVSASPVIFERIRDIFVFWN